MPYLDIHMLYYICIFCIKLKQNVTQKYWYFKVPINCRLQFIYLVNFIGT